jgi:hypothetical protein
VIRDGQGGCSNGGGATTDYLRVIAQGNEDFRQKPTSPTINAGVDTTAIAPADFFGVARVAGSVDVGALEESSVTARSARLSLGLSLGL